MTTVGTVESLWRYPVKSMSGEAMTEAFMGLVHDILLYEWRKRTCIIENAWLWRRCER